MDVEASNRVGLNERADPAATNSSDTKLPPRSVAEDRGVVGNDTDECQPFPPLLEFLVIEALFEYLSCDLSLRRLFPRSAFRRRSSHSIARHLNRLSRPGSKADDGSPHSTECQGRIT